MIVLWSDSEHFPTVAPPPFLHHGGQASSEALQAATVVSSLTVSGVDQSENLDGGVLFIYH